MNNLTFKQYKNIDLGIMAVLLIISEAITTIATDKWFYAQPVAISTTLIFTCIVMMRWSGYAFIHAALGGLVMCIASGANFEQYIIYTIGNCAALIAMLWFKYFGKDGIRKNPFKISLFVTSAYIAMQIGRWVISLFFSGQLDTLLAYLGTDIISLLFAVIIMICLKNTDGMIEDQKAYLFRIQREEKPTQTDYFSE